MLSRFWTRLTPRSSAHTRHRGHYYNSEYWLIYVDWKNVTTFCTKRKTLWLYQFFNLEEIHRLLSTNWLIQRINPFLWALVGLAQLSLDKARSDDHWSSAPEMPLSVSLYSSLESKNSSFPILSSYRGRWGKMSHGESLATPRIPSSMTSGHMTWHLTVERSTTAFLLARRRRKDTDGGELSCEF